MRRHSMFSIVTINGLVYKYVCKIVDNMYLYVKDNNYAILHRDTLNAINVSFNNIEEYINGVRRQYYFNK